MTDDIPKKEMYLTSRVIVTLEYDHPSNWDVDARASGIMRAAAEEAERTIRNALLNGKHSFRILHCEPKLVIGRHSK